MDFVLEFADDWLLDNLWAKIVPLSAFAPVTNSSLAVPLITSTSNYARMVSNLPHPPIKPDSLLPVLATDNGFPLVSAWPRDYVPRQLLSLIVLTLVGIHFLYFLFAWLSYRFIFDHRMMQHPRFLKNQVKLEIECSLRAFPGMTMLTLPWFQAEVMGYSKLYDDPSKYGYFYLIASVPLFLLFTDYCIYWVHRTLHHPRLYKTLHKPHHKWLIPTPFASHAFHPIDGYLQSVPYHLFIFIFPLHRMVYLALFVFVNFWSIFIHDSDMITGHPLEAVINGPAHHTLHHLYFTVNYGQYFTWVDRTFKSYRQPETHLDPLLEVLQKQRENEKAAVGKQH